MSAPQRLKKPISFTTAFMTYMATEIIGEGGSGRIFKATDDNNDSWAIKQLDVNRITKEKLKRFKNEVLFCLRNRHPHIINVTDHGVYVQGETLFPFYVMPLYHHSLRDLMRQKIGAHKVVSYFGQILDGVEAAHLQQVVHRDLKPENILYDAINDRLILADFGIALFLEDELHTAVETKDTTRLANFLYAAPEQRIRGSTANYPADIYALGLILNEMFTEEVPQGTGYRKIGQVVEDYEYLDPLVEEMLRQSPSDRIDSIEGVKQQLISRGNEFIRRQRFSQSKEMVVPVTDLDDPLISDPPRIINFDWNNGTLTLFFQHMNPDWVVALRNMGSYSSLYGKGPEAFSFSGNQATINVGADSVQRVIDYFKGWIPLANHVYERRLRQRKREAEEKERENLRQQLNNEEARQRVFKNVRL